MRPLCVAFLILLFGSSTAFADKTYKSVPAAAASHGTDAAVAAEKSGLDLKVVSYDGATNGELTVEVKNPGKTSRTFIATGLYFVPDGKADEAPQRLGAVGPMQMASDKSGKRLDQVVVEAGQSVQVKLDVFCIDSHRASPSSKNTFTLGSKRLPAKLHGNIETRAKAAVQDSGGYAAPASKSRVQSEVWQARDAEWIEIDGEGKQEIGKKAGPRPRPTSVAPRQRPISRTPNRIESVPAEPVQNEAPVQERRSN